MRYASVGAVETIALAAGLAVGALSAVRGAGLWSLVAMHASIHLTSTAGAWIACGWRPGRPAPLAAVRELFRFGSRLTGFRLVNYLSRNADDVLIGRFAGAAALGLYGKAYKLLLVPVREIGGPASSVVVAGLSRLQNDPERFRAYYVRAVLAVAAAGMPAVALLFVLADEIVALLLGEAWSGCVPLFRILAPAAFVGTFHAAGSWACTALGRTGRMLRWQLVASTLTLASFAVGVRWGAAGVAAACSVSAVALRYPALRYLLRGGPVGPRDVAEALWRPATASLVAAFVTGCIAATGACGDGASAVALLSLGFAACYAGSWMLLPGGARWVGEGVATLVSAAGAPPPPAVS
jgi:O-antigen/teichoic acid export membrane protein